MNDNILSQLRQPFEPSTIQWRVGATNKDKSRGLALAYADSRQYQERLDNLFGLDWSVRYAPVSDRSVICELTLTLDDKYVTRSATGNGEDLPSAEAQAFKRACSAFGLGRYLYGTGQRWEAITAQGRSCVFTPGALESLRRSLAPQTAPAAEVATVAGNGQPRASEPGTEEDNPFAECPMCENTRRRLHALGSEVYGAKVWGNKRYELIAPFGHTSSNQLTEAQAQQLIRGLEKKQHANMVSLPAIAVGAANVHVNGATA